jgi:anaerobic selenocysteine-containing dehydrogenase
MLRTPPISFKWVLKAKDKGAKVIHVDPKFSRTRPAAAFTFRCAAERTSPSWAAW